MKTVFKVLAGLALVTTVAACTALAADPPAATQTWTPGWRHEQMVQARQDGTFTPGPGMVMRGGGPGYGRGMMAAVIGPDGKIDPTQLPEGCPYRQAVPPRR
ncbi:hypothetical protein [Magnetospirillum sp. SS-4]|uniref:hypothetical protein n=1 Tax=Magnetospirillum sp. SS-4 TaxID=2681465 RepID=UPI001383631B|nr:hypothetical protein [Magnetospirillum sp. SS-4]CAA7627019.1 conserved exported hypothetical protein [Magnetospirillum sp. SS-4]